jgi:hypothetical protein
LSPLTCRWITWPFDKVGTRHDHPARLPDSHHDISGRDLLDGAPFILDNRRVVDAYRLCHSDFRAGEQITQQLCVLDMAAAGWQNARILNAI